MEIRDRNCSGFLFCFANWIRCRPPTPHSGEGEDGGRSGCPSAIWDPKPETGPRSLGDSSLRWCGQARPVGGSRLEPARFGSYGKPIGGIGGASASTVRVACSLPASEAVTAVTSCPPTTHHFLDTLKFAPVPGFLLALADARR